jgi:hypothetical protein
VLRQSLIDDSDLAGRVGQMVKDEIERVLEVKA